MNENNNQVNNEGAKSVVSNQVATTPAVVSPTATPRQASWRRFGHIVTDKMPISQAIKEAGLDYNVGKQPLVRIPQADWEAVKNGENPQIILTPSNLITTHSATFRDDSDLTLGVVGKDYGVVQNTKAFEFIDFINQASDKEPIIETCGTFNDGARMFITCRLGEDTYLSKEDAVKHYAIFTNSHDGTGAVMAFFTPVRVVCQNTLAMAIHGCQNKVIFKHTKNVNARLDWEQEENRKKALEVFSKSVKFSDVWMEQMLHLKDEKIDQATLKDFAAHLYLTPAAFKLYKQNGNSWDNIDEISTRAKNQMDGLLLATENGIGQDLYRGSKLWLINGLTTYQQNEVKYKSDENQFVSQMEGGTEHKRLQRAYEFLTA